MHKSTCGEIISLVQNTSGQSHSNFSTVSNEGPTNNHLSHYLPLLFYFGHSEGVAMKTAGPTDTKMSIIGTITSSSK